MSVSAWHRNSRTFGRRTRGPSWTRQRSSDLLRESDERFRAAFESSVVGFAILRLDTTFVQLNDAFCRLTGYARDELNGMRCASLTHPDDQAHADAMIAELLSGARSAFLSEKRYLRKDGAVIWVQNSVSATRDPSGHPQHLVVVCQDVTERRQASDMKDQFLATLSHELRTPLSAVLGWAQMLRSGALPAEATAKALESIERNARAQVTLVDELLDVSRIITGKLEIEQEVVDLMAPIANAVDAVRPAAAAKHLSLSVSTERSAECYVRGDAGRLQQVFVNLLSNAVKFTPEGGAVQVAVHCSHGHAVIRVRDSGQGISPELQQVIFERFRQGDSATTQAAWRSWAWPGHRKASDRGPQWDGERRERRRRLWDHIHHTLTCRRSACETSDNGDSEQSAPVAFAAGCAHIGG